MPDVSDQWWAEYTSAVVAPKEEVAAGRSLVLAVGQGLDSAGGSTTCNGRTLGQLTTVEAEDWHREFALDPAVAVGHRAKPVPRPTIDMAGRQEEDRTPSSRGSMRSGTFSTSSTKASISTHPDRSCRRHHPHHQVPSECEGAGDPLHEFWSTDSPTDHLRHARRDSQRVQQMLSERVASRSSLAVIVFVVFDELVVRRIADATFTSRHVDNCCRG